jgi:hypothetical protein
LSGCKRQAGMPVLLIAIDQIILLQCLKWSGLFVFDAASGAGGLPTVTDSLPFGFVRDGGNGYEADGAG